MAALRVLMRVACLAALLAATACSVSSAGRHEARERRPAPSAVEAGEIRFEALAAQPLDPGACGLFLWTQSAGEPVFVLAAFAQPAHARVRIDGRDHSLSRTNADGQAAYGHFERQTFSDGRLTLSVDVVFDPARSLVDGMAIQGGVIRVSDRQGWETIVPVGGLLACEN